MSIEANGFTVVGVSRRKPQHFEILGRDKGGFLVNLQISLDGTFQKSMPISPNDEKWYREMGHAF